MLPTQDPGRLRDARIAEYQRAIAAGDRPLVVAAAWVDARHVASSWSERFLSLAVLNGHHRVEAYARSGVPAPVIAVARASDSWPSQDAPDQYLHEAFELLAPPCSRPSR